MEHPAFTLWLARGIIPACLGLVDAVAEVASIAVLHDDAQAVLVEKRICVTNDVGVAHAPQ